MEEGILIPPRKKQKLEPPSLDGAMDDIISEPAAVPPPVSATNNENEAADDRLSKEAFCGITEFVSPDLLGFTGILKKRYTDFVVNEILPSGQVVHLDNLKAPKRDSKKEARIEQHDGIGPFRAEEEPKATQAASQPSSDTIAQAADVTSSKSSFLNNPIENAQSLEHDRLHQQEGTNAPTQKPASLSGIETSDASGAPVADHPREETENVSPHKRIPAPPPYIPLSMQDSEERQPEPKSEKPTRKKHTVKIKRTSQGWVETDETKESETKEPEGTENSSTHTKIDKVVPDETINVEPEAGEERVVESPKSSSAAQWQAYAGVAGASASFELQAEDKRVLLSYFSSDVVDGIVSLYNRIVDSPHRKSKDYGVVKSGRMNRQLRTRLHQDIRRMFNSRLESVTGNDGAMIISAMPEKSTFHARVPVNNSRNDRTARNDRHSQRSRPNWQDFGGDYLHFSLFKENKDTMEAISWLAKELKMPPKAFQFAGTKDRRAVTVQRVSVYRVLIEPIIKAGRSLKSAKIGNFEYKPHPLQLGELNGNEFVITLRDCDFHYPIPMDSKTIVEGAETIVAAAIENLSKNGFLNYYGLQRFGTFSASTDDVGLKLLQGDFHGAVEAILHFNPASLAASQDPTSATDKVSKDDQARAWSINEFKTTGVAQTALRRLPKKFSAETSIIHHLGRSKNDYFGALQSISRNLRLMYVHAYQSLVWNMAASERWKKFGPNVIEGDLILIDEHKEKEKNDVQSKDVDVDGEAIVRPSVDDRATDPEDMFTRARALTKEEAESNNYTIFDVVLPTPGYDILYPANPMFQFFKDFMGSERGGGLDPYDMRRKWKDISLSGSYRKLLARPLSDVSFEVKAYKNDDEQFIETDLDRLNSAREQQLIKQHAHSAPLSKQGPGVNTSEAANAAEAGAMSEEKKAETESSDSNVGGVSLLADLYRDFKIAVILKLQLGSSQYATMALRELMKQGGVKTYKPDFGSGR